MTLVPPLLVSRRKLTDYLLAREHPDGRGKALFFEQHGFRREAPDALAEALRRHATEHEVARMESSPFGERLVVDGPLLAPDGRRPFVRSVWFREHPDAPPRLVTAYPLRP